MVNAKFERVPLREVKGDEVGIVNILIRLRDPASKTTGGGYLKGNVTRTLSVQAAKVSDVARAIELALFGDTEP